MPRTVESDGQQVTLYEQSEVRAAEDAARQGMVAVSERDSAAAAARREAEQAAAAVRQELQQAQARVQALEPLEAQVQTVTQERDGARQLLQGVRVLCQPDIGLRPDQAEVLLATPLFQGVDLADETQRAAAVERMRQTFPGLGEREAAPAPDDQGAGSFGGVGGSPAPGRQEPDAGSVEKMSQAEFERWRGKG